MGALTGIGLHAQNSGLFTSVSESCVGTSQEQNKSRIFLTLILKETGEQATISYPSSLNGRVQREIENNVLQQLIVSNFRKYIQGQISENILESRLVGLSNFFRFEGKEFEVGHLLHDSGIKKRIRSDDCFERIPGSHTTWFNAACSSEKIDTVREMLEFLLQSECHNIDMADLEGVTGLMAAVQNSRYETIELLLAAGADPNARDLNGATPLHRAARLGSIDIIRLLIEKGAVVVSDNRNYTPLYYLIENCDKEDVEAVINCLIFSGDNVHAVFSTNDGSYYNLMNLAASQKSNAMQVLLNQGVSPDFIRFGDTVYDSLCSYHSQDVRCLLLQRMSLNLMGSNGNTPLHYACNEYFLSDHLVETIEKIIGCNQNLIHVRNREGMTPVDLLVARTMDRNRHLFSFFTLYFLLTAARVAGGVSGKDLMPTKKELINDENDMRFFQLMRLFHDGGAEASLYIVISLYRFKLKYYGNSTLDDLHREFYFSFLSKTMKYLLYLGLTKTYGLALYGAATLYYLSQRIIAVGSRVKVSTTESHPQIHSSTHSEEGLD